MYLMIVDYCNMSCAHCGMNAKYKSGDKMSIKTFRNALKFFGDESITIGGGEPTLHPKFWQIVMESAANTEYVWMATNGSNTKISLDLAKLAKKGIIGVALSQDSFHDPIDKEVIQAFKKNGADHWSNYDSNNKDLREIRNTEANLIQAGRCQDGEESCICEEIVVLPNGDVKACGCSNAPIFGNVNSLVDIPEDWSIGVCHNKQLVQ